MTREEAHEKLYDVWSDEIHYKMSPTNIVNKIYDDFELSINKTLDAAKYTESAELVRTLILQMKENR